MFIITKYRWYELLFSNRWQWVRRLSKTLWAKEGEGQWVKFSEYELDYWETRIGYKPLEWVTKRPDRLIEDWRITKDPK